jgi:hypothetical protein
VSRRALASLVLGGVAGCSASVLGVACFALLTALDLYR